MKLVDLADLSGSRLHDPVWLERFSHARVRDCFCLFLCADVSVTVFSGKNCMALTGSGSIVLPPASARSLRVDAASPQSFAGAVFFELNPLEPLHGIAKLLAGAPGPARLASLTRPARPSRSAQSGRPGREQTLSEPPGGARSFFADVNAQFVSGSVFRLQAAAHQTAAFLYALAEERLEDGHESRSHAHIEKALGLMHLNSNGPMTLRDITTGLRLSEAYFIRLFKKVMHLPPMKYFTRLKLHNAALLLMQGLTIKEAAGQLGFYSESHFSKQFKQYMGVPPKRYKPEYIEALKNRDSEADKSILLVSAVLSRYIDSVTDMVFVKDTAFVYRGCNTAFCRYVGKEKENIFGHTDFTLFPPDMAAFYRERDERIFSTRRALNNEEWITFPNGERALVEVSKSPYFGPEGELLGMIGISRIISNRAEPA